MKAVLQRVKEARVSVNGDIIGQIDHGLLILLAVAGEDEREDLIWLANKIIQMRIFSDNEKKMNHSLIDTSGALLVVSQFTLHASTKKGNRPSFIHAAPGEKAEKMYLAFIEYIRAKGISVQSGIFGADMQVSLVNDGPVTIIIDSRNKE